MVSEFLGIRCLNFWSHTYRAYYERSKTDVVKSSWNFLLLFFVGLLAVVWIVISPGYLLAGDLPENFQNSRVLGGLQDPAGFEFSPDGRIFISERITGNLLVANEDTATGTWVVEATPFHTFQTPRRNNGTPLRRRSAGLRDIAFDPDFASNGFIYVFYMHTDSLQNRVVRIKQDDLNPDISDSSFPEEVLIELPFNNTSASGSHNGGGVVFGTDGTLYISTGDGWTGTYAGDSVQSLSSYTGKVFRINKDGTIPPDNPFYTETAGDFRAIYALGLRNPFSLSLNPATGSIFINEARGVEKADVYLLEAGANYGHQGSDIGNLRLPWNNVSTAGSELVTGGAWYPASGPFPVEYHGGYFVALWGGNGQDRGQLSFVNSETDLTVSAFETDAGHTFSGSNPVKPTLSRIGPDGNLYYLQTTYETTEGTIQKISSTNIPTVSTPSISPGTISSPVPVTVTISTATEGAQTYYTLDNTDPTENDFVYTGPIIIEQTTTLGARAFKDQYNSSSVATAIITIEEQPVNEPPIVNAGDDKVVTVNQVVALDGSSSTDPDGDDAFLTEEQWTQLAGPSVVISEATEEVAFFTPLIVGVYEFQLSMSDTIDTATDTVVITVEAENTAPVAVDDQFTTSVDNAITYNLLGNDTDAENDELTISAISSPEYGSAQVNVNNTVTYTPASGFSGQVTFTYLAHDGELESAVSALVTVTVNPPPNLSPVAVTDVSSTSQGTAVTINVLSNDTDEFPAQLTVVSLENVNNGTAIINPDFTITFTPDSGFTGVAEFNYIVSDGVELSQPGLVRVTVESINLGAMYIYVSSTTNGTIPVTGGNLSYRDEDIIRIDMATNEWEMFLDGSDLGLNSDINAFALREDGTVVFSLTASTSIAGIGAVDDSDLLLFSPDTIGTTTSGTLEMFFDGSDVGLSANAEDIHGVSVLSNGSLVLSTNGNISVPGLSGDDSDLVEFQPVSLGLATTGTWHLLQDGSDIGLNTSAEDIWGVSVSADESSFYFSTQGDLDTAGITATAADVVHCNAISPVGCELSVFFTGILTAIGAENIDGLHVGGVVETVPVNLPPVARADVATTTVNTATEINVLLNDSDANNDKLTVTSLSQPGFGQVVDNLDGTVIYTPNAGFIGDDSFNYRATDGIEQSFMASVNVTVREPTSDPAFVYLSSTTSGVVNSDGASLSFRDEDVLRYEMATGSWEMFIDGSDLGFTGDINAFSILSDGSVLLSLTGAISVEGLGIIDDSDIIRFIPVSTGTTTSGSLELFFDGSDVDLNASAEDLYGITGSESSLLLTTVGQFAVDGASGLDRDIIEFTVESLGADTSGSWSVRLLGANSALNTSSEDIWALGSSADGHHLFFSTVNNFLVDDINGNSSDILDCEIQSTASGPVCNYSILFRGADIGFGGENIDAIHVEH